MAVDMRSEHPLHIDLCRNGNCNASYVSFNLHRPSSSWPLHKSMMQSYYSIAWLEDTIRYVGSRSRLPNHTSVRCSSSSHDLIYDIVQVWADVYQWRNALKLHTHEHDNLGEFVAISTMRV
jgi:hypothetical protein